MGRLAGHLNSVRIRQDTSTGDIRPGTVVVHVQPPRPGRRRRARAETRRAPMARDGVRAALHAGRAARRERGREARRRDDDPPREGAGAVLARRGGCERGQAGGGRQTVVCGPVVPLGPESELSEASASDTGRARRVLAVEYVRRCSHCTYDVKRTLSRPWWRLDFISLAGFPPSLSGARRWISIQWTIVHMDYMDVYS